MLNRGSYLPGPQELYTALASSGTAGERAMILPGSSSRLGQPSSRWPIPSISELSTVGMAKHAGDPDAGETVLALDLPKSPLPTHAHHSVQLDEGHGRGRVGQVDLARLDRPDQLRRKCVDVHLQPHRQRGCGNRSRDSMTRFIPRESFHFSSSPKVRSGRSACRCAAPDPQQLQGGAAMSEWPGRRPAPATGMRPASSSHETEHHEHDPGIVATSPCLLVCRPCVFPRPATARDGRRKWR